MQIINLSGQPLKKIYSWLPHGLQAEKVIFFPDACPSKSPLPTGTAVFTRQADCRKYAISDCGCGILLAYTKTNVKNFDKTIWDSIYYDLKANKGKLGDLGSGNHFLDALESFDDENTWFLIHTGSRNESNLVDDLINFPNDFDSTFKEVCLWAENNRLEIFKILKKYFPDLQLVLDKNHNHYEFFEDGVIIRKGAVQVLDGDLTIIPSHMSGDVVLVKAINTSQNLNSLCHGTGRAMSRADAKVATADFDFDELRRKIYIPDMISNNGIKTDAPFCYRDLDECLGLLEGFVEVQKRFSVIAYLGQI